VPRSADSMPQHIRGRRDSGGTAAIRMDNQSIVFFIVFSFNSRDRLQTVGSRCTIKMDQG
jgi:hypothetical protein